MTVGVKAVLRLLSPQLLKIKSWTLKLLILLFGINNQSWRPC